ncbi:Serine/threonine-protein phosphatase 4 catalytic subunit [Dirofilaria immitis]
MDRKIMIALIHQTMALIDANYRTYIVLPDESLAGNFVYIVGSIDGDLNYLVTLFKQYEMPPKSHYIFLGDYLDCFDPKRIDALLLLLSMQLRYPRHICLFRGHHETYEMCKAIGFDQIVKFLCAHAGISPFMSDDIFLLHFAKPTEIKRMNIRERCVLTDILYGIPDENLPALFAPSNIYPIGNRFSLSGLNEILEIFDCLTLIRGCGRRESNGFKIDLGQNKCISIASGCSAKHVNYERYIIQIFQYVQIFINHYMQLLQHTPSGYRSRDTCIACEWIAQGKRPENVTISHTLLKNFIKGMLYPYKLHDHFSIDPRLDQYMHVELFPLCNDFYYHGFEQLILPIPYFIDEHPLVKPPMIVWNEKMSRTSNGAGKKSELEMSYIYSNRIIRPGYDLEEVEQPRRSPGQKIRQHQRRDLRRLYHRKKQLKHWVRNIVAPYLSYKYRVERLPDENNDNE